ncbi:hypothetical protein GCM10007389_26880 [Pontibacter akesuensis]|nr:hypothetical protein GCM10007389_26880 [Pontibacter akesuensis]
MNYSKVNGIGTVNGSYDWDRGYHLGVALYTNIGEDLFLQPELLYTTRGYNYTRYYKKDKAVAGDTVQLNQHTELNYLDIPVLVRLQLRKVYFEAGPQFGVHLSGKKENMHMLNRNGEISYAQSSLDTRDFVEPFDIGFIAGVGYQSNTGIGLGLRYNQGFREVVKRVNWEKNILLQASVSYIFGYKKYMVGNKNRPAGYDLQDEYYDPAKPSKAKKAGYKITTKRNVQRVSIVKMGESARPEVKYEFNSMGANTPTNVLLSGSSGEEINTPLFMGFRDIQFPFKGVIRYTTQATVGIGSIESILEFEITEPGIWRVNIMTQ